MEPALFYLVLAIASVHARDDFAVGVSPTLVRGQPKSHKQSVLAAVKEYTLYVTA
jgi:hypothetical protein